MSGFELLEPVFRFFASSSIGLLHLPRITAAEAAPMGDAYEQQLSLIAESDIEAALADGMFQFFNDHVVDIGERRRRATEWVLARHLEVEIPKRRLERLRETSIERPSPYDHPALADINVSADQLVSVREFDYGEGVFSRNGFVFSPFPAVESPNAPYWLMQSAAATAVFQDMWVRLDPFLWGPEGEFLPMSYRMLVYGVPLDWHRVRSLRKEDHGRWQPGPLSSAAHFTDYVWSPRGSEVHFQCEEVPLQSDVGTCGTRYLHAIYSVPDDSIIHLDGAVRVMTDSQWTVRQGRHVRSAGKVGHRAKLFRVDGAIAPSVLSDLAPQFFVWNHDVARYFGAPAPAEF